ncbi:hypothetical protein PUN71_022175 [Arthrobacter sp. NQ7]|nr:hypothetical protein [Arthrobacter sp. NQ7]MDJ0459918.1 hypothetical protein [Arthrobacter sp. NQ7]
MRTPLGAVRHVVFQLKRRALNYRKPRKSLIFAGLGAPMATLTDL